MTIRKDEVWIGLLAVRGAQEHPKLDGCVGAYTHMIAMAADLQEFRSLAKDALLQAGLTLEEVLWAESLCVREKRFALDEGLLQLADALETDGIPRFGVFHGWESDA